MKIIVADSSSLILLTKCNLLDILTRLSSVIIPDTVFNEVVNKDTLERFVDARTISIFASKNKVEVVKIKMSDIKMPITLGRGETEALLLAKQTSGAILATDDGKAIKACRYLGVPFIVSPKITTELYRLDAIDFAKARSSIEKMKIIGRYSSDIISEAILELEVIRDAKANNR